MATTVRTFNESDWETFSGAESFLDGTTPLIREESNWLAIAERSGIELYIGVNDPDFCSEDAYRIDQNGLSSDAAKALLALLPTELTEEKARAIGFTLVRAF